MEYKDILNSISSLTLEELENLKLYILLQIDLKKHPLPLIAIGINNKKFDEKAFINSPEFIKNIKGKGLEDSILEITKNNNDLKD